MSSLLFYWFKDPQVFKAGNGTRTIIQAKSDSDACRVYLKLRKHVIPRGCYHLGEFAVFECPVEKQEKGLKCLTVDGIRGPPVFCTRCHVGKLCNDVRCMPCRNTVNDTRRNTEHTRFELKPYRETETIDDAAIKADCVETFAVPTTICTDVIYCDDDVPKDRYRPKHKINKSKRPRVDIKDWEGEVYSPND